MYRTSLRALPPYFKSFLPNSSFKHDFLQVVTSTNVDRAAHFGMVNLVALQLFISLVSFLKV